MFNNVSEHQLVTLLFVFLFLVVSFVPSHSAEAKPETSHEVVIEKIQVAEVIGFM